MPRSPKTAKAAIHARRFAIFEGLCERVEINVSADEFVGLYWEVGLWQHGIVILTKLTILNVEVCEFC